MWQPHFEASECLLATLPFIERCANDLCVYRSAAYVDLKLLSLGCALNGNVCEANILFQVGSRAPGCHYADPLSSDEYILPVSSNSTLDHFKPNQTASQPAFLLFDQPFAADK